MTTIKQTLTVNDWPLTKAGDTGFFGYVVAMGIHPGEWEREDMFTYVDFAYSHDYTRYRLPAHDGLIKQLSEMLQGNIWELINADSFMGKVHITRGEQDYTVELP